MADDKQKDKGQRQLEQLVSYLDNELNEDEMQAVEQQIRENDQLRRDLKAIERTWGLLDALEPVSAGEQFSSQTMQTVRAATETISTENSGGPLHGIVGLLSKSRAPVWFAVGIAGTLFGLTIADMVMPEPESTRAVRILRELEMLKRYPEYSGIPNTASLRQLNLSTPFHTDADVGDDTSPASQKDAKP